MKLPERWQKAVNKTVNTMFNKVKENEKCVFYFYLKTERTFWPIYIFFSKDTGCRHYFKQGFRVLFLFS